MVHLGLWRNWNRANLDCRLTNKVSSGNPLHFCSLGSRTNGKVKLADCSSVFRCNMLFESARLSINVSVDQPSIASNCSCRRVWPKCGKSSTSCLTGPHLAGWFSVRGSYMSSCEESFSPNPAPKRLAKHQILLRVSESPSKYPCPM